MRRRDGQRVWLASWLGALGLCLGASLAMAQPGVPPAATASTEELGLVVATAGVAGEIAQPRCDGDSTLDAQVFSAAVSGLAETRAAGALVLDAGGLIARHGVARFAAEHAPDELGRLVAALGYHALAFSEADLGDPRARVLSRTQALNRAGVPTLATNLRCEESAAELCDALVTGADGISTFDLGEERVAVLAMIEPEALSRVAPDRRRGLRIEPLGPSLQRAVAAARARGATTVLAILDTGFGADAMARAVGEIAELAPEHKPDAVISAGAGSELLFARPAGFRPAFVAPPPRGAVTLRMRRTGERYDLLATPMRGDEDAPLLAPVQAFVNAIGPRYCAELGQPMAGAAISEPMDATALADMLAGVMRETTHADVALLNREVIDGRWQPAHEGGLSPSDVLIAVQYDEPLVTAEVNARWLRNLARAQPEGIIMRGLEITGAFTALERIKINGRVLDDTATYEVVTVRFLAEGGDAAVALPDASPADGTLRSVLTEYLEVDREGDPREALVDPYDLLEWTSRVDADLTFTGSAVRDAGAYGEGPLTNQSQLLVGLNFNIGLNALSRYAAWENAINASYSLASTTGTDGFQEGADQLTYRTSAQLRRFRTMKDEIYVPDLIVEGLLRTEFTQGDERDSHFMNLRFVAGPQWRLHRYVQTRLVGGLEVLEALDDDARSVEPGVGAQFTLQPWKALIDGARKLTLGFTADYFVSGLGGRNRHLLQGLFDMELAFSRMLAVGLNVTMYGLSENGSPFSFAVGTTASLRVGWTGRWLSD